MTNVSKAQIAILIGVVGLLSAVISFYRAMNGEFFYFEIAMRSSQAGTAQVFYDVGRGFNEADSARLPAPTVQSITIVRFSLPPGEYRAIRFDPIDHGYSSVVFRNARISNRSGHVVRSFSVQDFRSPHDIADMRISDETIIVDLPGANNDPQLTVDFAPPLSLHISKTSLFAVAARTFILLFLPLSVAALCWLLFVPPRWSTDALLLVFLVAFVSLFARSRFLAPISWDEELFLWQGWMVKNGSVPYRDFFEPKPPFIFLMNALGLALFGLKDNLFRILPTAVAVGSILLFYLAMIKRRLLPWLATLLSAQVALWLFESDFHEASLNDSETYGLGFTLIGYSLGLLSKRIGVRSQRILVQVLSGICFGLAISSKELFVASAIPAWILAARPEDDDKWDWRQLLFSATGVILVGISTVAYLMSQSALGAYLDLVRFYRPMAANYCMDIGRFPRVSGLAILPPAWKMLQHDFYNLSRLAFVLPLLVACIILPPWRARLSSRIFELVTAVGAVLLGIIAVSVGFCFWKHYFLMGVMGVVLLSVIGARAVNRFLSEKGPLSQALCLLGLSGLFVFVASDPFRAMLAEKHTPQSISVDPVAVRTIEAHSKPGDYILVTEAPLIYLVVNRKSALGVCGMNDVILPYTADIPALRIETLRDNLEKRLPKVCYFSGWMRPRQQAFHKLLFDPFLAEHRYVRVTDRLWHLPDGH